MTMTAFTRMLVFLLLLGHARSEKFLSWLDDAQTAMNSIGAGHTFDGHPNSEEDLRNDLDVAGAEAGVEVSAETNTIDSELDDRRDPRVDKTDETTVEDPESVRRVDENDDIEGVEQAKYPHEDLEKVESNNDEYLQARMNRALESTERRDEGTLSTEAIDASVAALERENGDADNLLDSDDPKPGTNAESEDLKDDLPEVGLSEGESLADGASHVDAAEVDAALTLDDDAELEGSSQRDAEEELQDLMPADTHPSKDTGLGPLRRLTNEKWATSLKNRKSSDKVQAGHHGESHAQSGRKPKEETTVKASHASSHDKKNKATLDVEVLSNRLKEMESMFHSAQNVAQIYNLAGQTKFGGQTKQTNKVQNSKRHFQSGFVRHLLHAAEEQKFKSTGRSGAVAIKLKSKRVASKPGTQTKKKGIASVRGGAVAVKLKAEQVSSKPGTQTKRKGFASVRGGAVAVKLKSEKASSKPGTQTKKIGMKKASQTAARPSTSHIGAPQAGKKHLRSAKGHDTLTAKQGNLTTHNKTQTVQRHSTHELPKVAVQANTSSEHRKPSHHTRPQSKTRSNGTSSNHTTNPNTKNTVHKLRPETSPKLDNQKSKEGISVAAHKTHDGADFAKDALTATTQTFPGTETLAAPKEKDLEVTDAIAQIAASKDDELEGDVTNAISQAEDVLKTDGASD